MKLIILKNLVVSYRKDNQIEYLQFLLFCSYIVSFVAKSNEFTSPNKNPKLHRRLTFAHFFAISDDVFCALLRFKFRIIFTPKQD